MVFVSGSLTREGQGGVHARGGSAFGVFVPNDVTALLAADEEVAVSIHIDEADVVTLMIGSERAKCEPTVDVFS